MPLRQLMGAAVLVPWMGTAVANEGALDIDSQPRDGEVMRIDFEDREMATADWSHLFQQAPGLPPVTILFDAVVDETTACTGRSSLRFDLQGGSISYRMRDDAAIPVDPGGRYRVSAEIRQTGLQKAMARIEARVVDLDRFDALLDSSADAVAESTLSIHRSETSGRDPGWTRVVAIVDIEATSESKEPRLALFVSLQVVQPGFDGEDMQEILGAAPIRVEDIAARVWFDDIVVEHLPTCRIDVASPGGVVASGERPTLRVSFDAPGRTEIVADLTVRDVDDHVVRRMELHEAEDASRLVEIDGIEPGWYEARLEIESSPGRSVESTRSFVVLPAASDQRASDVPRFGVQIPTWSPNSLAGLDAMLRSLRPSLIDVSLWPPESDDEPSLTVAPIVRSFAIQQRRQGREVTVSVDRLHDGIARLAHVDAGEVHTALSREDAGVVWQSLGDLMSRLGAGISRWRFASAGGSRRFPPRLDALLEEHVADPHLSGSVSTDRLGTVSTEERYLITSSDFSHDAEAAIGGLIDGGTILISPAPGHWSNRDRLDAGARRILQAWRHGADRILVTASLERPVSPLDLAWHVLGSALGGRRFVGELNTGATSHCWVAADERGPVMVVWADVIGVEEIVEVPVGNGSFTVITADGAVETRSSRNGVLALPVGTTPKIVTSVDPVPVGVASSIQMIPDHLDLADRIHDVVLKFRNPNSRRLAGVVKIDAPDGWSFTPAEPVVDAGPRQMVELPVRIEWNGPQAAGVVDLPMSVEIDAFERIIVPIKVPITLESDSLEVDADWDLVRKGDASFVRVKTTIRNIGDRTMDLSIAVSAPGLLREQRSISALPPGGERTRALRLLTDIASIAGQTVRIEIRERGGPESLVYGMDIPKAEGAATASVPVDR